MAGEADVYIFEGLELCIWTRCVQNLFPLVPSCLVEYCPIHKLGIVKSQHGYVATVTYILKELGDFVWFISVYTLPLWFDIQAF